MSAVATLLVAVPAAPVQASCSQPIDQITAIRRADSVFVGRVIELADFNRMATMQVIEIWKGSDLDELVTVSGSTSGAPQVRVTDRTYTLRSTYLVVPFGSRSPFSDDACSATGLFVPLGGQIPPRFQDAVGATTARFPITAAPATGTSESSGGFGQQLLVGGSIVMLALVVLVRRRRKKSATPKSAEEPPRRARSPVASPSRPGDLDPQPVRAAVAVAGVAKRRPRRPRRRRYSPSGEGQRPGRLSKSGLANLETLRKKARRARDKHYK